MNIILDNTDKLTNIVLMITISLYLRMLLQIVGQTWVKTIAHTSTLLLLPILTYVITSVISGNIALSLGMVGALSIVRFRNPVRSPLELSVYFGAITLGITTAVSIKWLVLLALSVTLVAAVLYTLQQVTKAFSSKPFFISSFSEGNLMSTLHVVASAEIIELDSNVSLSSKTSGNGEISYSLADSNFETLKAIEVSLRANSSVVSIQLGK
tara:strand:+ start:198 stop:830 length:633 start_codon:yes stop_codon:yes gene_type:complete